MGGEPGHDLRYRRNLERSADNDDEVYLVAIVLGESSRELIGKSLAEEGDIGLHDTSTGDVILGLVGTIGAPPSSLLLCACRPLTLRRTASSAQSLDAAWASRDLVSLDLGEDGLSRAF